VLPYWQERSGFTTIHASAVTIDNEAIAYLATNHGGKTSLAASHMLAGFPLLTDDLLVLKEECDLFWAQPGYPQMRMWPEQANYFCGSHVDLPIVHPDYSKLRVPVGGNDFGEFDPQPRLLRALFLPERSQAGTKIEIAQLGPAEAYVQVTRNEIFGSVIHNMNGSKEKLARLSRLISSIPVCRLSYPSGYKHLPEVHSEILKYVDQLKSSTN